MKNIEFLKQLFEDGGDAGTDNNAGANNGANNGADNGDDKIINKTFADWQKKHVHVLQQQFR